MIQYVVLSCRKNLPWEEFIEYIPNQGFKFKNTHKLENVRYREFKLLDDKSLTLRVQRDNNEFHLINYNTIMRWPTLLVKGYTIKPPFEYLIKFKGNKTWPITYMVGEDFTLRYIFHK